MNDNYFEDLDDAVKIFQSENQIIASSTLSTAQLETFLFQNYNISVNRKKLGKEKILKHIRSFYTEGSKILYINRDLESAQENFLIARELGFQYLKLKERPYETVIQKAESFEKLFNNFKASYFASALLMDENALANDFRNLANATEWSNDNFMALLKKYNVTAEMMLQRLTNILPKMFKINDLFFIRLKSDEQIKSFKMTKELHLSRLHKPYANEMSEHYCRRWVSVNAIKELRTRLQIDRTTRDVCAAQISTYWETDLSYFCLTVAKPDAHNPKESSSVTLGILMDDNARRLFRFLGDPNLKQKDVNTTCERCSMPDCSSRAVAPIFIEKKNEQKEIEKALKGLN